MGKIEIRSLEQKDIPAMHEAFQLSFSDYQLPFQVSRLEFQKKFIEKLKIDFQHSVAAFDKDKIVGFLFTSIGEYEGKFTAYNGGTGVLPAYRGLGLVQQLYNAIIPKLRVQEVEQCLLEVLTSNKAAIKAYYKVGFKKSRYLKCFNLKQQPKVDKLKVSKYSIDYLTPDNISVNDWLLFDAFSEFSTSYLDNINLLGKNIHNENVVTCSVEGKIVAYAIFQENGRISRLGVDKDYRRQGIGSALIDFMYRNSAQNVLTIVNIAEKAIPILKFLTKLGFINQVDQYELKLPLR